MSSPTDRTIPTPDDLQFITVLRDSIRRMLDRESNGAMEHERIRQIGGLLFGENGGDK